jgi:hypothetical protein
VRRAIAGPHQPRPGSWSRPRHLQLVSEHQASASSSAGVSL